MNSPQILQQLQGKTVANPQMQALLPQIQNAKQMIRMIKSAQNPQLALQQMLQSNPRYAEAMQVLNSFNGDANSAIMALCQKQGIDPNEFMNMLNNL